MAPGQSTNGIRDKCRRCDAIIGSLVFVGLLSAGASSQTQKGATVSIRSTQADKACVHKLDFSEAPKLKALAERARRIGNEIYPKVLAIVAEDTSKLPHQFDIVFKKYLKPGHPGRTQGAKIRLVVVQMSKDSAWKLQKAWRTGQDGRVMEE